MFKLLHAQSLGYGNELLPYLRILFEYIVGANSFAQGD
jgi:hypothetical protein